MLDVLQRRETQSVGVQCMKSGLNRDKYQNFSGIRTRVMNSLAIVANALTTGLFLTCHVKLLIHKVFRVGY